MGSVDVYPPRTGRLLRDDGSILNEADFWSDASGLFGKLIVAERTPLIELKTSFGLSDRRDIQTTSGSASITNTGGEHKLTTTSSGDDAATLDSAQRGQYIPGSGAEAGMGIRYDFSLTGDQFLEWGYADDDNGFLFKEDADGLAVVRRRAGSETTVRQADWNGDTVDGSDSGKNPSGFDLDPSNGYVYQIRFAWYGYGVIEFSVFMDDSRNRQRRIVLHRMKVDGENSVENPNLPLRIKLDNNGTANAGDIFVGGRQYSVLGHVRPNERVNGEFRQLADIGTSFEPVMSFRKKSNFDNLPIRLKSVNTLQTEDMRLQIRLDADLTGASFGSLTDVKSGETGLEVDTSATALSGGDTIRKMLVEGGSGNKTQASGIDLIEQVVPPGLTITLAARTLSGTGTLNALWNLREEW